MAEGIEEAETNSSSGAGDAMLSAAMPCEVHEFETYHHQAIKRSVSTSPTPKIMPLMPQTIRKVHETSNDFESMSQYLQQHRLHQQRKSIATKRKQSTDVEDECTKQSTQQQQQQHQQQQQQQQQSTSQHDDDQLSQSSCSSLAPISPPLRKLKTEAPGHGYVKCENLSPMQLLESEQEGAPHHRMDEPTKVGSDSLEEKEEAIDEDIIHEDAETNILEQSQQDVANLLNSQNALAAAAAAAAVAANTAPTERLSPEMQDARLKLSSAAVAHINGTMQKMLSFQNLQNLASLQQQKLSFVGLAGLTTPSTCLNSPLNLSLGSSSHTDPNQMNANCGTSIASELAKNLCAASAENFSPQMPQLILASGGQLMQGVQVAQLLIPSPQGISTQTILTIPVSQQVNSNDQLAQTLAALNNCPSNQQVHPHQKQQQSSHQMQNLLASPSLLAQQSPQPQKSQPGPLNTNLFSSSVQELLAAIQPNLFDLREQQNSHRRHSMSTNSPSPNYMQTCANESSSMRVHTPKHSPIRNSHFENREAVNNQSSVSTVVSGSSSSSQHQHQHPIIPSTSPLSQYTPNGEVQKLRTTTPPHNLSNPQTQQREGNDVPITFSSNDNNNNNNNSDRSIASNSLVIGSCSGTASSGNSISHHREHSHSPNIAINSINRLTTSNGELTITKSQGLPPPPQPSTNSTSSKSAHSHSLHHQSHRILPHHKNHHSHHQSSSTVTTPPVTETADDESPNEPTINQTNCNVVDGIDLDEIKEFAKAFKLRRLSLGLTQTQVGQALSVTEGPAYSQSAICSALAAQMYAAQLSSQQQQNMFEKLDITPKSAQKIKPVLERWMKEAEERHWNHYKSGQSHLTDFIGVEPSKKRKRRTSFTPQALELLNAHFERNTHPSGTEITGLAHQLGYEREVIRIWFCNKRQALKNTVRMMSKGMV